AWRTRQPFRRRRTFNSATRLRLLLRQRQRLLRLGKRVRVNRVLSRMVWRKCVSWLPRGLMLMLSGMLVGMPVSAQFAPAAQHDAVPPVIRTIPPVSSGTGAAPVVPLAPAPETSASTPSRASTVSPADGSTTNAPAGVPALQARVTDLTGTLDTARRQGLEQRLAALEQRKGAQVAVLIVPTTAPDTTEQFATRVFDAW